MIPAPDSSQNEPSHLTNSSLSPSTSLLSSNTRSSGQELSLNNASLLSPPPNTGLSSSYHSDAASGSVNSAYLGLTPSSYSSTVINSVSSCYWDNSDLLTLEESFRSERDGGTGGRDSLCSSSGTLCGGDEGEEVDKHQKDYKWDKDRKRRGRNLKEQGTRSPHEQRSHRRVSFNSDVLLAQIEDDDDIEEEDDVEEEEPEEDEPVKEIEVEVEVETAVVEERAKCEQSVSSDAGDELEQDEPLLSDDKEGEVEQLDCNKQRPTTSFSTNGK